MIWIIAGTADARKLAGLLLERKYELVLSVVSEEGRAVLQQLACKVHVGAMDNDEMRSFIRQHRITTVIDASHPFAAEVSKCAIAATHSLGVRYIRYERPQQKFSYATYADSYAEVVTELLKLEGKVLLTTGTRMLSAFADIPRERLLARVLPNCESIQACSDAGIVSKNIVAIQRQLSQEMNSCLIQEFDIRSMVSKDSGATGGLPQKVDAARLAGIPIFIIRRPKLDYPEVIEDYDELVLEV